MPAALVARLAQDRLGGAVQLRVLLLAQERRGGLLHQLLVAALERAVTGGDDDHVAVLVGQALGLHVPGAVQVALDEALAAPEGGDGLTNRRVVQLGDLCQGAGDLQAASAAAEGGLDGDGQAVLLGEGDDLVRAGDRVLGARDERGARALGDVPRGDLVAEVADGLRGRADPGEPGVQDGLGEFGVLGQEPVPGVDGVGARIGGGLQYLGDIQVARCRGVTAQGVRLVGHADVQRVPVRLGIDGDARDSRILAGAGDADSDFAAIGDEHLAHDDSLLETS